MFDDGDRKRDVPSSLIRSLEKQRKASSSRKKKSSDNIVISKGDRVEAKLKGWTKYYKGKITRENRDGTYDILFDDGERKSKVDAKLIKSLETKSKKTKKKTNRDRDSDSDGDDDNDSDDDEDDASISKGIV